MCNIQGKTRKQIGYKLLAYKKGKFYSIFTGQQIKIGDVPKAPKMCNTLTSGWSDSLDTKPLKKCGFYDPSYNGNTSAFIKLNNAKELTKNKSIYGEYKLVIVKIKLAGNLQYGYYSGYSIIAGNKIKSINIVKTI